MKRTSLLLAACAACMVPVGAHAGPMLEVSPAATLLFPYFEVDLANADGTDTLLSIHAASANAVLTHVVVWSAAGVPVTRFNLYLTGYDVETFSMRAVMSGMLPQTASDAQDTTDVISPQGTVSQDITFPGCDTQLPPAAPSAADLARTRAALTGAPLPSTDNRCAAPSSGMTARGYVTVDVVNACDTLLPGETGYFVAGGTGVAGTSNQLLGEFILVQRPESRTVGAPAVHLSAVRNPQPNILPTFYGALVGWTGIDGRDALPGSWAANYEGAHAEVIVWRDPKVAVTDYPCADGPAYGTLPLSALFVFDRQERVLDLSRRPLFPDVVNRVTVGDAPLPVLARSGWLNMNLHHASVQAQGQPIVAPGTAQAVVLVLTHHEKFGTRRPFTALRPATPMDPVTQPYLATEYP